MHIHSSLPALVLTLAMAAHAEDTPTPATSHFINRLIHEAVSTHPSIAAAQGNLAAEQRMLHTQLTVFMTEAENHRRLAAVYASEVLPKTEKTVETLQNAWVSSKATLLEVLEARRALLQARQEQRRALAAQNVATQVLAALTGSLVTPSSR